MNSTRLISTLAAVVAALAAAAPAAAEAPTEPPFEEASALFGAEGEAGGSGTGQFKRPGPMQAEGGGGGICWGKELLRSKGTWPYVRRLYLYTVWCGSGGTITYRSSSVRTSHDAICWTESGPFLAKMAGGAGYSFVEVQTWAGTACHSPLYFVSFHDSMMLRVRYYPNGGYATVAYD
jgi:hypothetical protein